MRCTRKAKGSPDFSFYSLYGKICRKDVLRIAYRRYQRNGGSQGVDGQTFEDIEAYGQERWVDELAEELKRKDYQGVRGRVEVMARKADHRLPKMQFQRVGRVGVAEDPAGLPRLRGTPRRP